MLAMPALLGPSLLSQRAEAAVANLTAAEWGGDIVAAMKQIAAHQQTSAFNWVLFQGGAGSILPKIKAAWPRVEYDYVAGWEGSFYSMMAEGWLVTVSASDVPNLADITENIIIKDAKGNWKAVPRAVGGIYFGYRTDTAPIKITSIDDLFSPKLKGAICWPGPTQSMMLQIVALALHAGGSEKNMEPGWNLMKTLAKSGNIGRVAVTDVDFTNSFTSGGDLGRLLRRTELGGGRERLPHHPTHEAARHGGLPVPERLRGNEEPPQSKATLDFINFAISPAMNTLYSQDRRRGTAQRQGGRGRNLKHLSFTPSEMKEFVYVPDYQVVLASQDAWTKRWEIGYRTVAVVGLTSMALKRNGPAAAATAGAADLRGHLRRADGWLADGELPVFTPGRVGDGGGRAVQRWTTTLELQTCRSSGCSSRRSASAF